METLEFLYCEYSELFQELSEQIFYGCLQARNTEIFQCFQEKEFNFSLSAPEVFLALAYCSDFDFIHRTMSCQSNRIAELFSIERSIVTFCIDLFFRGTCDVFAYIAQLAGDY